MTITEPVRDVLKTCTISGDRLTLPGTLDRKTYVAVNDVLTQMGGKWNSKAKAHIFPEDPSDAMADAVTTGEILNAQKDFEFFATPPELARRIVQMAGVTPKDCILEPSAGAGAIMAAIEDARGRDCPVAAWAYEIIPEFANKLQERFPAWMVIQGNFLEEKADYSGQMFDKIIMNPPFSKGQDIKHVRRAWDRLKPGGVLVAIMSPGWTFNENSRSTEFREFVAAQNGETHEVEAGTFKESGTMIRTVIVKLVK